MKRAILILLSLLPLFTASCERNSYSTFSKKYLVTFSYGIAQAPFNQITTPGRFVSARISGTVLKTVNSDGETTDLELTEIQARNFRMGLAGLIIGTPTFNNDDMSVWAYDLGCPVCDVASARLRFDVLGQATCSKCGNSWDLNSSGFPTTNESGNVRTLYRYPVYRAADGSVTVSNR